jgi:predicted HTH domain antitoxin
MNVQPLVLNITEDFLLSIKKTPEELVSEIVLMAAIKMFELGKLSSGKASELAGISRREFLEKCSMYGVSVFNYSDDEIAEELSKDEKNLQKFLPNFS